MCIKTKLFVLAVSMVMPWAPLKAGSLEEGKKDYSRFCMNCHGESGRGQLAQMPDFSRGEGLFKSNRALRERIETGDGLCPSYKALLSEQRIDNVVRYLRTLR